MKHPYATLAFSLFATLFLLFPHTAYPQAVCRVDQNPVKTTLYLPDQIVTQLINFNNKEGQSQLHYQLSIQYNRTGNSSSDRPSIPDSLKNEEFTRVLQYEKEYALSYDHGAENGAETIIATQYNAGKEGLNISDVGTWFIPEDSTQGIIRAEIRAGGSSVEDAFIIATGEFEYSTGSEGENGKIYNIPLEKEAAIYPNEDFYVVFTYPSSVIRPQGCVKNDSVRTVPGRYLVNKGNTWKDFQLQDGNENSAFITYVAEKTPKNIGWLRITSHQSGVIVPGDSSQVNLQFDGSFAVLGEQQAEVIFHTNDSINPVIKVPVILRMNEAPHFIGIQEEVYVVENTSTDFEVDLVDLEQDSFMVENIQGSKIVSYNITPSKLTFTIAPHIGDTGTYQVKFKAIDKFGASREVGITIHVALRNNPPVYSGESSTFIYSIQGEEVEYNIRDWFADPEGDYFTFTASSQYPSIAEVVPVNDSLFIVRPKSGGETTLDFVITDSRNETINYPVTVIVGLGTDPLVACRVDQTPIKTILYYPGQVETPVIKFDNKEGKSQLKYLLSIRYNRTESSPGNTESIPDSVKSGEFTRVLQYEDATDLNYAYGIGNGEKTTLAVQYNAGAKGMNISDVGTWFIAENFSRDTVRVEIRAGGSSVEDALPVATGELEYIVGSGEENGRLYNIPLEKEAAIYPYEDFYVVFTYPVSTIRSQGCVRNEHVQTTPGKYLIYEDSTWKDFQQQEGNANCAYISYAAEKTPKDIGWVNITSNQSGIMPPGDSSLVNLQLDGSLTVNGEQQADVIFRTNDPINPVIEVPVSLRMNEAPHFIDVPEEIRVDENSSTDFEFDLADLESNAFTVENIQGCKIVSHNITPSKLAFTVVPYIGDAGTYQVQYRAIDEYGASRVIVINILVIPQNRPPAFSGETSTFVHSVREKEVEYNIRNFFTDPDGDNFTFTVSSQDPSIVEVAPVNDSVFVVRPITGGETVLDFVMRDARNGITTYTFTAVVGLCANPSAIIVQKWNNVLLVNNYGNLYVAEGYQWYKNNEPIPGATGQYYSAGNRESDLLDFTAEYYVRLVSENNDTTYTCPMVPVNRNNTPKAYPNPVVRGGNLNIEVPQTNTEKHPVTVQIVNLSGKVVKTWTTNAGQIQSVQMPAVSGIYIVKVIAGNEEKVFNIRVE